MKRYDVWFSIANSANFVVEAASYDEAWDIAQGILENMDNRELMRKLNEAMDFDGLKIDDVREIVSSKEDAHEDHQRHEELCEQGYGL